MKWKKKLTWRVEWDDRARKEFSHLDPPVQKEILKYLRRIENSKNPKFFGKSLTGNKSGLWRYRIGNYRLVCKFEDEVLIVIVISLGHRKEIYR